MSTFCPKGGENGRTRSAYPSSCLSIVVAMMTMITAAACLLAVGYRYTNDKNEYNAAFFNNATNSEVLALKDAVKGDQLLIATYVLLFALSLLVYGLLACRIRKNESNLEESLLGAAKQGPQHQFYGSEFENKPKDEPKGKWWRKC